MPILGLRETIASCLEIQGYNGSSEFAAAAGIGERAAFSHHKDLFSQYHLTP
jgi:hypothetical protein